MIMLCEHAWAHPAIRGMWKCTLCGIQAGPVARWPRERFAGLDAAPLWGCDGYYRNCDCGRCIARDGRF